MSALFCPPSLQQDRLQLLALLESCQQRARQQELPQIASFTLPLGAVDPLAVLQAIASPTSRYFYWEHPDRRDAEVALDTAVVLETSAGRDRFARARQFVRETQARMHGDCGSVRFYHGFSFFETSTQFPSALVVLPRWQVAHRYGRSWLTANLPIEPSADLATLWATVTARIDAIATATTRVIASPAGPSLRGVAPGSEFVRTVTVALKAIDARTLEKVVLAHNLDARRAQPFDPIRTLAYLRQHHPHCTTFAASPGQGQTFLGASPERLVARQGHEIVCDALAGSVRRGRTDADDAVLAQALLASKKEQREHQAVKGFLCDRLQQLGLEPRAARSRLLKLTNIQHLWTPIRARVSDDLHLLDLVAHLHPTPAVAGLPAATACDRIRSWEGFDRGPYAAPFGWLDRRGDGEFVVGIRSALLQGTQAQLYAGAGIVAGSTPERERAEVELKLQAMLRALA